MGLKANIDMAGIHKFMEGKVRIIESEIVRRLQYLGEECVNMARQNHAYMDQTGNLTSSIGYVVTSSGTIINQSDFNIIKSGNDGNLQGISLASDLARNHSNGFALIVVAGMNYAKYVEAMGLDVLSSSELIATKEVPKIMKELKAAIKKVA